MIESLHIGIPKDVLYRVPSEELTKFERITGIKKTRRFEGSTLEMIYALLDTIDIKSRIDQIIVVTQSPDRLSPCMAVSVQEHLSLPAYVAVYDVNRACDGWVFGLDLCIGRGKTLLICADRLRYEPNQIESFIFSDSVSATIVDGDHVSLFTKHYTNGSCADILYAGLDGKMKMDGPHVFDFVTTVVGNLIKGYPHKCDILVPHQANLSMLNLLAARSGYKDRWLSSIEEYGNQSMNSIPTAIAHNEDRAINKRLLLAGFGAGYTATLMAVDWPETKITTMVEI